MALIRISQWPEPVEAGRLRILEAALDAGVPYPHGCGSGECGGCKTRLLSGHVTLDRYSPDALSEAERADGLILACRARLASDVHVRWLSAAAPLPMVKFNARVATLQAAAHDVVVVSLALPPGASFAFRPGQFAKLRMGSLPARSYSMANQPGEPQLEFHVRVVEGGLVSSYVAQHLEVGDTVEVRGPFGDAFWEDDATARQSPLLLLAGGTGLAPILSVLDAALGDGFPAEQIHVYHGVRSERDLYAAKQLAARIRERGFRFVPVFSQGAGPHGRGGLLHEAVAQDFADLAAARVHVAGPPAMVDAVKALAQQRGVAAERIRADAFVTAEPAKKTLWERITGWGDL